MEWLKTILGDAYSDEIDDKVSKEVGKGFVARADFNAKTKKLGELEKALQDQTAELDTLRSSNADAAAIQKQLKEKDELHAQEIMQLKLGFAVESALKDAGARNVATVKPLLETFLKDAKFADDGTVEGLNDQIKALTENDATSFLFAKKTAGGQQIAGAKLGTSGNQTPPGSKAPDDMTYGELCDYLEENPGATL
ncbi:MAG: phage scaffolding protein [Clostridia bacterium]|nr:phage scaffolding protein [Clostridia bacterium]